MEAGELVQVWLRMKPGDKVEVRYNGKSVWQDTCKTERYMEIMAIVLWEKNKGDYYEKDVSKNG